MSKLVRELKLLGINPTPEQSVNIINAVLEDYRSSKIKTLHASKTHPVKNLLLAVAFSDALNTLMYSVDPSDLRYELKREFMTLRRYTDNLSKSYINKFGNDKTLKNAFEVYSEEVLEMLDRHLQNVDEKSK